MPRVHLRKKAISKDRHSWYLDFSPPLRNAKTGKAQRFEFLELFTYDRPGSALQRQHNSETRDLIENIRSKRQLDIQNRKFGFISDRDRNSSFIDYFREFTEAKQKTDNDNYPYAFSCYATEKLIRASSTVTRKLITQGKVSDLKTETDNNPHGFLIQGWEILQNNDEQIKTTMP